MWWRYDAPRLDPAQPGRWSRTMLAPRLIETRLKLCGEEKPLHEALNYAPSHHYGTPAWFGDPDNPRVRVAAGLLETSRPAAAGRVPADSRASPVSAAH